MPKIGDVLFYKDFEFEDGSKSDKLFVVVVCSKDACLVLKTTTNNRLYQDVKDGCNAQKKVFFIPKKKSEFFDLDTYVQFPQLFEITVLELLRGGLSKAIKRYDSVLSDQRLQLIKDCLKYFKNDISSQHWDQIFSKGKDSPSNNSLQKLASKFNTKKE